MNPKKMLTDGVSCPVPWTGLMYNFDGKVKNCIRSAGQIGDLKHNTIEHILQGPANRDTQDRMLAGHPGQHCHTCYDIENGKKNFDIISDRIFYIKELKHLPMDTYQPGNHDLRVIDVRWTNLCNFACVYCGPEFSSRWQAEIKSQHDQPLESDLARFKDYIFDHVDQLQHVYMAGGEPLLMKQNLELLELLKKRNPGVNLRINTNLSKVDTSIFHMICGFKNVHWTVSIETMEKEFEYIRFGGSWQDFQDNLMHISSLSHKISFNMLYFLLNYRSLFDCIDWLRSLGFHPNSFIAGALLQPVYLNIRHLPDTVLQSMKEILMDRINDKPGYLLEDSYKNLMHYIDQPFAKDLAGSLTKIQEIDSRRNLDSSRIFTDLYNLI